MMSSPAVAVNRPLEYFDASATPLMMRPFSLLFVTLIAVPLLEIYLLLQMGSVIGAINTLIIVILTAMIGAWLLRQQGLSTLFRLQQQLNAGALPASELIEAAILLVSGALLLTPGFFTDAIGFIGLLPGPRQAIAKHLLRQVIILGGRAASQQPPRQGPTTIDGEFSRDDDPQA